MAVAGGPSQLTQNPSSILAQAQLQLAALKSQGKTNPAAGQPAGAGQPLQTQQLLAAAGNMTAAGSLPLARSGQGALAGHGLVLPPGLTVQAAAQQGAAA